MALVEAARYHTLSEAEVAASLLRSAGIPVSLSDTHYGSVFWMAQKALGGFRISVPEQDLADSVALLDVPPADPDPEEDPVDPTLDAGRRTLVAALAVVSPETGWLFAKNHRSGPSFGEVITGASMALAAFVALLLLGGVAVLIATILTELVTNPP